MSERMDAFISFVRSNPNIRAYKEEAGYTWQDLYEKWYIEGENTIVKGLENVPKNSTSDKPLQRTTPLLNNIPNMDMVKNAVNYIKKIDPDKLTNTLSSAQKVMAIIQGFLGGGAVGATAGAATGDPLFDKKFDDWYN